MSRLTLFTTGTFLPFLWFFSSCEKILDPKPDDQFTDEFAWGLPEKAEGVLMNAYANIMTQWDHYDGDNFLDVATDNAVTNDFGSGLYRLVYGGICNQTYPLANWDLAYEQFRYIHLFMENGLGDNVIYSVVDDDVDATHRRRLLGEAYFLRAWWGMELLRTYGGVAEDGQALGYIIITENIESGQADALRTMPRNTYEECVQQITQDADSAIKYLPLVYQGPSRVTGSAQYGRATKKAAWALRSRLHTLAASPAYQPQGAYAISADSLGRKWERAAVTSYRAITEGELGNYQPLQEHHLTAPTTPSEFIFRMHFSNNHMELRNFPPAFFGQGKTNPSQNLVDAFPDSNGYPIDHPQSVYDPQNPYVNRDPRLDLTVYYNGRTFDDRPLEIYYDKLNGRYGQDAAGYHHRNTRTGYYLRKWLATEHDMLNPVQPTNARHMHALLRRSEVYFNLAEALNEAAGVFGFVEGAGPNPSYNILSSIRSQNLDIPSDPYALSVALSGEEQFRDLILNERRIEFAFENMRYYDMRRWLMPLDEAIRGCEVVKDDNSVIYHGTDSGGLEVTIEKRALSDPRFYYAPLPLEELLKNPLLKDNKGWTGQ